MTDTQLDLFAWVESRPTAKVISIVPIIIKRMWQDRNLQTTVCAGQVIELYPLGYDERKSA
jgi:hypothetical protein